MYLNDMLHAAICGIIGNRPSFVKNLFGYEIYEPEDYIFAILSQQFL